MKLWVTLMVPEAGRLATQGTVCAPAGITGELLGNADSQAHPDLLNPNLHFNKSSGDACVHIKV